MMLSSSGAVVTLDSPVAVSFSSGGTLPAVAGYQLNGDGNVYTAANSTGAYSVSAPWINAPTLVGNFEARATLNSGSAPSGSALATWLNLATTRTWELGASAGNILTCNLTIEIRNAFSLAVVATASVTLTANAV